LQLKNVDNYTITSYNKNVILSEIVGNAMIEESNINDIFREEIIC